MSFTATGLNHRTSPIALRERLDFDATALPNALQHLKKRVGGGVVVLSPCNRVEVYTNTPGSPDETHAAVREFISESRNVSENEFADMLYEYADRDAVVHLFRVASSLDSLVVGEGQILGQVHDAYLAAQAEQAADKVISAVFQRAFAVAKDVRTNTRISEGKVSIGSVAVDLAVRIFTDLKAKTIMIIGSGKMGEQTLKSLVGHGVGRVLLVNRSHDKAVDLAEKHGGEVVPFDELESQLYRADVVISSTGSDEPILGYAEFQAALKERGQDPMFVIDIAVPRDIDARINELDNIYLYDIDGLRQVAEANMEARRNEIDRCMRIVDRGADQFMKWMHGLLAEPTIVSMAEELNTIREQELEKTLRNLGEVDPKVLEEIEYLSKRIVNKILQKPMSQLKREVTEDDPHNVLHIVKRLFGLQETK
jgi:glutamyl-tRNA reductase